MYIDLLGCPSLVVSFLGVVRCICNDFRVSAMQYFWNSFHIKQELCSQFLDMITYLYASSILLMAYYSRGTETVSLSRLVGQLLICVHRWDTDYLQRGLSWFL
jgi:hypothetical protein